MNYRQYCFTFFLLISSLYGVAQNSQPVITADTTLRRLGEQIELTISLQHKSNNGKTSIIWPAIPDTLPGNVFVIGRTPLDTLPLDKDNPNHTLRRQKVMITAFDSGKYTVGPFAFVVDGDSVFSNEIEFEVKTFVVDTTQSIKDIKEIVDVPYSLLDWLNDYKYYLLTGLAILVGVYFLLGYLIRRKRKNILAPIPEELQLSAHEAALKKLMQLKKDKAWLRSDLKYFYSDLTNIVREYIEKRYQVMALEQTTSETLHNLRFSDCPDEDKNRLRELLSIADLVKFAKQNPDEFTAEKSLQQAIEFVEHTRKNHEEEKITDGKEPE